MHRFIAILVMTIMLFGCKNNSNIEPPPPPPPPPPVDNDVLVSWFPTEENDDGSSIEDLKEYIIYYSLNQTNIKSGQRVVVPANIFNESDIILNAEITDMDSGVWFFAITAVNEDGVESELSNVLWKVV